MIFIEIVDVHLAMEYRSDYKKYQCWMLLIRSSWHVTRMFHVSRPSNATFLEKGHAQKNSTAAEKNPAFPVLALWEMLCGVCAAWHEWNNAPNESQFMLMCPVVHFVTYCGGQAITQKHSPALRRIIERESPRWAARRPIAESKIYDMAMRITYTRALKI